MRGKIAKLINRQPTKPFHTKRELKRLWNRTPRSERHKLRMEFEENKR